MEDLIKEKEIKDKIIEEKEKYKLALDYYSKNNPFQKIIIATGTGVVGSYSTSIIAASLSSTIYIAGHAFFTDTAFLVASGASTVTGIGLAIAIPCLIGGISYQIYKYFKSKSLKEYMEKLSDLKNESMKEEREIYIRIFDEFKQYFQLKFKEKYEKIIEDVIDCCNKIIEKINQIKSIFKPRELKEDMELIKNKVINDKCSLNILIIGSTGVGKSTLINEILKLKNNKAEEGKGWKPMKIDSWPKKYPIYENDSEIKNIFLYDTEGIEKSNKDGNDMNSHFSKIKEFLDKNEKINAIWYCINGNRLDGDEDYLNGILKIKKNIPIIFIYTKAYSNKEEDIESMHEGLKEFDYFKKNPNEFHFFEVISKDLISKIGEIKERSKGLKELKDETISLSEKSFYFDFYNIVNKYYNKKADEIVKNLSKIFYEHYQNIIYKKEKFENFKKYINEIFNCSYNDFLKTKKGDINDTKPDSIEINNNDNDSSNNSNNIKESEINLNFKSVEDILKLVEKIKDEDLNNAIKSFSKREFYYKVKDFIQQKYEEKKSKSQTLKEFNSDIDDYILTQLDTSKDIYGLYFLYDMIRETILHEIIEDLNNDFNQRKMNITKELDPTFQKIIKDFKQKFN